MSIELNPEQRACVEAAGPDLFIAAAAGSGKTRVLTERFVRAVAAEGVAALERNLTITFTDKAAGELAERVREALVASGATDVASEIDAAWISTIHGMCARILRRHALDAGIDPLFVVGSEIELSALKEEAFERAALQALDSDPVVRELLGAWSTGTVAVTVDRLHEQLRSMGAAVADVGTLELGMHDLEARVTALESILAEYKAIRQSKTTDDNKIALVEILETARGFAEGKMEGFEALRRSADFKQGRRGDEEAKEAATRALERAADLRAVIAGLTARPFESLLLRLVQRYGQEYAQAKSRANLLDFEDLQSLVAALFERRPDIAALYAGRFAQVMVDEFQDTNPTQVALVSSVAPRGFVSVGDEKQSIYAFRHADVELFRSKRETAADERSLATNYRSHPALLRFYNELFGARPFWPDDFLKLAPGRKDADDPHPVFGPGRVTALLTDSDACGSPAVADEARAVAARVRALVDAGVPRADIVLLLRAMSHAEVFADAIRDEGLEAFVAGAGAYFDRPEVLDLEMLLRVVSNPLDDEAFAHVLAGPLTGISENGMARLRGLAGKRDLWSARTPAIESLGAKDAAGLARAADAIEWARAARGSSSVADLIHELAERLEYDITLFAQGQEGARSWTNVLKLARMADEFGHNDPGAFLEHVRLRRQATRETQAAFAAEGIDAVRVMSVHSAKGLEFPVVVLADLGHQRPAAGPVVLTRIGGKPFLGMNLPPVGGLDSALTETPSHTLAVTADLEAQLAEEKRIFYVACTRAEEALVLSGRTKFAAPASEGLPIGWLRESLGFEAPGSIEAGVVHVGAAPVAVVISEPGACEPAGRATSDSGAAQAPPIAPPTARTEAGPLVLPDRISYSGIAQYLGCPYRFFAARVLGLGSMEVADVSKESPTVFGSAVHALLSIAVPGRAIDEARAREICAGAGLASGRVAEALTLANAFLEGELACELAAYANVRREVPFAVPVAGMLLDGSIDLLAREDTRAVIVDYKTGHTDPRYDATSAYELQAACYAIAAFALGASDVRVDFVELERESRTITFRFEADAETRAREIVEDVAARIRALEFRPLARYDAGTCSGCPALGGLCPVTAPRPTPAA